MSWKPDDESVCRNCKWSDGSNCHRFPPQMVLWPNDNQHPIMYAPMATFPLIGHDDWCGEWTATL